MIYGVGMGQGISVATLVGNTLITGYGGPADKVQSCSAVMLVNTNDWRAGLYHFPEGSINTDGDSIAVLTNMKADVQPNEGYIAWGEAPFTMAQTFTATAFDLDEQLIHNEQLRSFLLNLLPLQCRLRRVPAKTGTVWIRQEAGRVEVGFGELDDVKDLRSQNAGKYQGHTLYGRDKNHS
jgi:hypothetical protein